MEVDDAIPSTMGWVYAAHACTSLMVAISLVNDLTHGLQISGSCAYVYCYRSVIINHHLDCGIYTHSSVRGCLIFILWEDLYE